MIRMLVVLVSGLSAFGPLSASAAGVREAGGADLIIASRGQSNAKITVSPSAGRWEKQAAEDLAHFIQRMTGARVPVINERQAIDGALGTSTPLLIVSVSRVV